MSRLDELIGELCPDGVTFQPLGNVCEIRSGWGFPNAEQGKKEGEFPFFKVGDMNNDGNEMFMYTANNYIDAEVVKKLKCKPAPEGTIIFPKIGAAIGTNKKRILVKESCYDNNVMGLIASQELNPRFLFYIMHSVDLMSFTDSAGAVPSIRKSAVEKYNIPVPPLEVQSEIVRILDNFTELTAELQAELQARKKQYEYYNNILLSFDNAEYKTLEELCDIVDYRGKTPRKVDDGIFLVTAKNIRKGFIDYDKSKEYISPEDYDEVMHRGLPKIGDVLITTEAPCGNVAQIDNENIALAQRVIKYRPKSNNLNSTFLKYVLLGKEFQDKLERAATGGTVKGIKGSKLHQLTIPVPSIEEQEHIVAILDRFDTLCNDISEGLPAEIEARQKQYEYYRDKLLTFTQLA